MSRASFPSRAPATCVAGVSVHLLAFAFVFAAPPVAATPVFSPAVSYATGINPNAVAVADLNGDGKPDIVAANSFVTTVSVFLGVGDGTFGAKTDFPVGDYPQHLAIGDLDGDSKPDLVVAGWDHVSRLLGNGDGGFDAPSSLDAGVHSSFVAAIDVSGDDKLDVVTAHDAPPAVAVLLGHGDGTFAPFTDYPGFSPYRLALGDLNGDGWPDIASADLLADGLWVFLGAGEGTYVSGENYLVGDSPYSNAIGDFDDDGKLDVVVASKMDNNVSVLLGNGDGTFGPPGCTPLDGTCSVAYPAGTGPSSVAVGDLDVDGRPDLAVTDESRDSLVVLAGNGDGSFTAAGAYKVGVFPEHVVIHDLNGDGRPDLVTADYFANAVSVLLNVTTVSVRDSDLPARFELSLAGANPFRAGTSFEIGMPRSARVRLEVYDALGRRVRTLEDGTLPPGRHTRSWDGTSSGGSAVGPGLFFIRLSAPGVQSILKAVRVS